MPFGRARIHAHHASHRFVDRYIPGYIFFGDGVTVGYTDGDGVHNAPPWVGKGIRISIDEHREVVATNEI